MINSVGNQFCPLKWRSEAWRWVVMCMVLKKAFNACRLKAWNICNLGKSEKQCKTLTKASPSLLEGSIYQYASPESDFHKHITSPSFTLSPPQQSPTTPKCSTPVRQQCKQPDMMSLNRTEVSSQCESPCTNYWVKEFFLTEQDRVDLFDEDWLNTSMLLIGFCRHNTLPPMAYKIPWSCIKHLYTDQESILFKC